MGQGDFPAVFSGLKDSALAARISLPFSRFGRSPVMPVVPVLFPLFPVFPVFPVPIFGEGLGLLISRSVFH
jgi:hypothetical protein